jgi:hypothetical protein
MEKVDINDFPNEISIILIILDHMLLHLVCNDVCWMARCWIKNCIIVMI